MAGVSATADNQIPFQPDAQNQAAVKAKRCVINPARLVLLADTLMQTDVLNEYGIVHKVTDTGEKTQDPAQHAKNWPNF